MLYVFHGTDVIMTLKKTTPLIDSLRAKRPDASYVKIDGDGWSSSVIEEHLGGQGLFSNKYIIFLDRVTECPESRESITDFIPAMAKSENIFIVLEMKLSADLKRVFEKHADKMVEVKSLESKKSVEKFNIFMLADAVGERNSFKAWSIYRKAIDMGIETESILGTIFWQVKSMRLASLSNDSTKAGLSPFVFSKSKRYASNYSDGELSKLTKDLIKVYHDSHRGLVDMEIYIEKMLLRLK